MIKAKNINPWDASLVEIRNFRTRTPDDAATGSSGSALSIATSTAGDRLTITNPWLPIPQSVRVQAVDAASTTLTTTVTLTGVNQFGENIEEAVSTASDQTVFTEKVFARIDKAILTAVANNASSDTLSIGWAATAATVYGMPVKINKSSSAGVTENGGNNNDTIKTVFIDGAAADSTVTVIARYHGIKLSGVAIDDIIQIVLNQPYGE